MIEQNDIILFDNFEEYLESQSILKLELGDWVDYIESTITGKEIEICGKIEWREFNCFIKKMIVKANGVVDDDLRVDINGITVSDTKWNVSWYYEDTLIAPVNGSNPLWQTEGFRKIVLDYPNAGKQGDVVKIWLVDVGSAAKVDGTISVTVEYSNNEIEVFTIGGTNGTIIPPNWPEGTEGPAEELVKTPTNRPVNPPSPPIYVPLGEFTIPIKCPFTTKIQEFKNQ